jgi:hypothetical protein
MAAYANAGALINKPIQILKVCRPTKLNTAIAPMEKFLIRIYFEFPLTYDQSGKVSSLFCIDCLPISFQSPKAKINDRHEAETQPNGCISNQLRLFYKTTIDFLKTFHI